MFGKDEDRSHRTTETRTAAIDTRARGGIAFGPILTGVVVAFGSMFLLSALVGGVLASLGLIETNVTSGDVVNAGIGAGIVLVIAQFLSYLWGGYTAGRMARGSGVANGLLVPLTAIVLALVAGAVVAALGATANLNLPFTTNQLPLENGNLVDWGVAIGVASLVAMFLGGALGGGLGARWHTKLEHAHGESAATHVDRHDSYERDADRGEGYAGAGTDEGRQVDLREADRHRVPAGRSGDELDRDTHDTHDTDSSRTYRR